MHISSKTRYAKKHFHEDKYEKTEREIEVPWIGTAEIAVRWKSKRAGDEWMTEKVVVPEDLEAQLAKPYHGQDNRRHVVSFRVASGDEALPHHATVFITEVVPYVFSPEGHLELDDTYAEVAIAAIQRVSRIFFDRRNHDMGVTSVRLGEAVPIPPRQPLDVQIITDQLGANMILEAIKKTNGHSTFLLGVKLVGYYRVRAHVRAYD